MKLLPSIIGLLLSLNCWAQTTMTSTDFLAQSAEDGVVEEQAQFMNYLSSAAVELPWIEELEVRTETNDFDLVEQEYLLRMRINSRKEQRLNRNLHNTRIRMSEAERLLLLNEALAERYDLLAQAYFQQQMKSKAEELLIVQEDRLRVLRRAAELGKIEPGEWIEAEESFFDAERDNQKLDNQFQQTLAYFRLINGTRLDSIDFGEGLPTVRDIKAIAQGIDVQPDGYHPLLGAKQVRMLRSQQRRTLEEVESNRWLEFIQARYQNGRGDPLKEEVSVSMGVRLPFKGSAKLDIQESEITEKEEEKEWQQIRIDIARKVFRSKKELELLIEEYELIRRQQDQSQASRTLGQYRQMEGASPMELLKIKEVLLQRERRLLRLYYDVVLEYLDLLEAAGKLIATPRLNYLSKSLESF